MDNIKALIEQKIVGLLNTMDGAAPSEQVQCAKAVAALASALSEVSGGGAHKGLAGIIQELKKNQDHE